ncbi:(deoxy)nucleoside triphosphate pyrophosphohydrolase [Sphingomicrobium lutaoense]|uniref:8-oxo-dGTP diphosphatase n=1 Tax=Sphingomicrobium lutaoense TaxID=515949 RepID=A0A839YY79_9SPHN|nr:(deoxy)nucleoside triphosphate pyrophosphohydrolase [Sphingomicrobium lutaoense]MBB3763440.1 8-oxo-dGTP diphosphatase [Sphingomicrobium lutaoense]
MKEVAAAIIVEHGKVLIARRRPGQILEGHWEFPGGKLEPNETVQECIVRELHEELGIGVTAGEVLTHSIYEYPGGAIKLIAIYAEVKSGEVKLSVHDALDWVYPLELRETRLAPADIRIAEEVILRHA